jgi:hypothetical protein
MGAGNVWWIIIGFLSGTLGWLLSRKVFNRPAPEPSGDLRAALAKLAPFKRDAWVPVTEEGECDLTASKFAGIPWLAQDEEWPTCPNCSRLLQLLLQLDLAALPARPEGCPDVGLLQLFYCANLDDECEAQLEAWAPFSPSVVVRIVKPVGPSRSFDESPDPDAFPPRRIVGWQQRDDFPAATEADNLGVRLTKNEDEAESLFFQLRESDVPLSGEKLMGWPNWAQGVEYPECPECERQMSYLFQIDSEHNLPVMFGDMGTGHITFCPNHPTQCAFAWACG